MPNPPGMLCTRSPCQASEVLRHTCHGNAQLGLPIKVLPLIRVRFGGNIQGTVTPVFSGPVLGLPIRWTKAQKSPIYRRGHFLRSPNELFFYRFYLHSVKRSQYEREPNGYKINIK